jgi:hypothetical protein
MIDKGPHRCRSCQAMLRHFVFIDAQRRCRSSSDLYDTSRTGGHRALCKTLPEKVESDRGAE